MTVGAYTGSGCQARGRDSFELNAAVAVSSKGAAGTHHAVHAMHKSLTVHLNLTTCALHYCRLWLLLLIRHCRATHLLCTHSTNATAQHYLEDRHSRVCKQLLSPTRQQSICLDSTASPWLLQLLLLLWSVCVTPDIERSRRSCFCCS
jgi:hypothetical protein